MNIPARAVLVLAMVAAGIAASGPAFARGYPGHGVHGGVRFGLYVGAPIVAWRGYYGPWPYYPPYYFPYYYPPTVVTVPVAPHLEQAPAAPQPGYWYYCAEARAYYPYVKECPGGWQRVSPQPG